MTRKRRVSEVVAACDLRDPLNLKAVGTDNESVQEGSSFTNLSAETSVFDRGGKERCLPQSNIIFNKKSGDSKSRLDLSKSTSLFATPPRLIKPLIARNPKDPLDLFGDNTEPHKAGHQHLTTTTSTVNLHITSSGEHVPKQNRKRRRNRSAVLYDVDLSECRPTAPVSDTLDDAGPSKRIIVDLPTPESGEASTVARKVRRSKGRKRKRRHGKKKLDTPNQPNTSSKRKAPSKIQKETFISNPPIMSPLFLLCSSVQSIFSGSDTLYIGACGDNGSFALKLITDYGVHNLVGIDRSLQRVRMARRSLGSFVGQLSLLHGITADVETTSEAQDDSKPKMRFPLSFQTCFGPVGPDVNDPICRSLLQAISFTHVKDYSDISSTHLATVHCSEGISWDTVILQESVISSILKTANGAEEMHRLLTRISKSVRTGGYLLLALGRLRWHKQLRKSISLSVSQKSAKSEDCTEPFVEISDGASQLHPLTQLRKFFRFRLVRRLVTVSQPPIINRLRRASSVSWRGISPYPQRSTHRGLHFQNSGRSHSATFIQASTNFSALATTGEHRSLRRYSGGHRIVFVLQKKSDKPLQDVDTKAMALQKATSISDTEPS